MQRFLLTYAALSGLTAVALGAFAAHGLKNHLANQLITFHTGVDYQMYHTLALAITAGLLHRNPQSRTLSLAGIAFVLGILLFSGSLYCLALGAPPVLGIITPLGGLAFLLGWAALIVYAYHH